MFRLIQKHAMRSASNHVALTCKPAQIILLTQVSTRSQACIGVKKLIIIIIAFYVLILLQSRSP